MDTFIFEKVYKILEIKLSLQKKKRTYLFFFLIFIDIKNFFQTPRHYSWGKKFV
jgi:hypothetical protein